MNVVTLKAVHTPIFSEDAS